MKYEKATTKIVARINIDDINGARPFDFYKATQEDIGEYVHPLSDDEEGRRCDFELEWPSQANIEWPEFCMKYLAPLLALKGCELYVTTEIKGVQAHFNVGEYRGPDSIVYMDADLFAGRAGEKLIAIQKILDGKTMDDTDAV